VKTTLRRRFGDRIKTLRIAKGISQEAFADQCGYARSYMSRVERGLANPSLDAVEVFAMALKIEVKELFETTTTRPASSKRKAAGTLVPFAKDGSCFNPTLFRPRSKKFTVGEHGKEVTFDDFHAALEYLGTMDVAQWRRPNKAGNWGRVVAMHWDDLPIRYWVR